MSDAGQGPVLLVGAGGHAKAVVDILQARGLAPTIYVDPRRSDWIEARLPGIRHFASEDDAALPSVARFVLAVGGTSASALARRRELGAMLTLRGWSALGVVHPSAIVSPSAVVGPGATVLAGAVVQPDAVLGRFAIVNSRAVVEHDAGVGAGSHVAPGAIVLGGAQVGEDVMIGAGAVVLPGDRVANGALVRALSVHSGSPGAGSARMKA